MALKRLSDHVLRLAGWERGHRGTAVLAVAATHPQRTPGVAAPDVLVPVADGDLRPALAQARRLARARQKRQRTP
jgi:hypothetical protein